MSSILVVGDVYAETQYFVDRIVTENQFTFASEATAIYGSKTLNAARIFSRLGNEVNFYAHVGKDLDGENAISSLNSWGIIPLVRKVETNQTGKIVVITNSHAKSAVTLFRGANSTVSKPYISDLKEMISRVDGIYAATNLPLESLYLLTDICHSLKKPIFLDIPNQHAQLDLKKLSSVDFFAPNRQEAGLLLQRSIKTVQDALFAAEDLKKTLKGNIIITLDKEGCIVYEEGAKAPIHIATKSEQSVDETAAGDIFRSVFFDHFLKQNSIEKSIKRALSVASKSTKIKGVDTTLSTVELD
jgi:sugar/nucleoside kinase (ribokinase family)